MAASLTREELFERSTSLIRAEQPALSFSQSALSAMILRSSVPSSGTSTVLPGLSFDSTSTRRPFASSAQDERG